MVSLLLFYTPFLLQSFFPGPLAAGVGAGTVGTGAGAGAAVRAEAGAIAAAGSGMSGRVLNVRAWS